MFLSPQLLRLATDARLVALVRERNPAAFEAIYNRHHRAILSFCRHMLGDAQEAEDAVQQTFLAAYSDLISSDKPIHLRAWLFTIARNRCYSLLRSRREQPTDDLEEPITEGLASQVQRRQDLRDLVVDLRRLPDDQRAALVLAELDALSHDEIATALDVPREKVKALVFQARESLVASRTARETDCTEIREQLATQRGGALRRGNLRRHLRECAGCRDFRRQVERQRRQLAALLPVVPTLALKEGVLGATVGGGAAAGIGTGGLLVSTALKSGLTKGVLGALIAGAGAATTIVATHGLVFPVSHGSSHRHSSAVTVAPAAGGVTATTAAGPIPSGTGSTATAGLGLGVVLAPTRPNAFGTGPRGASSRASSAGGSFIRAAALNPFTPLLGIPKVLKGGSTPRSPALFSPPAAPVVWIPPAAPVTAPTVSIPAPPTPTPGATGRGSNGHVTGTGGPSAGSGHGDQTGAGGRTGSTGSTHSGGGDTGSGAPTPQRGTTGNTGGGTRGSGATGSSGAGGTGNTGNTGTTGNTGATGSTGSTPSTGSTGATGSTGNTGSTGTTGSTSHSSGTGTTGTGSTESGTTTASTAGSGSTGSTTSTGDKTTTVAPTGTTRGDTTSTRT
jgi:RNA polymerase sigma factor (sigma-70 family)